MATTVTRPGIKPCAKCGDLPDVYLHADGSVKSTSPQCHPDHQAERQTFELGKVGLPPKYPPRKVRGVSFG